MSNKWKEGRRKKLKIKRETNIKAEKKAQASIKPKKVKPGQQVKIEVLENNSGVSDGGSRGSNARINCKIEHLQEEIKDPDNCRRLGVDEQYIKFRPSPNFKNMKKFLKSKIDNSESSSQSPPNGSSEHTTPNNVPESPPANQQEIEKQPVKPVIHPPLPLEPPPPDPLPVMPVPIKNEIIDTEYQDQNGHGSPNLSTDETDEASLRLSLEGKAEEPDSTSTERPKVTVCRDFIRGTCSRAPCRFAHQRDLSQLSGVYTFCRNYQNSVCTLPLCKYVHASVFEEQEFYRTGILPLHVQNHMKQKPFFVLPPPPPPPPEEIKFPEVLPEVQNASALSTRHLNFQDKPLISCVPVSELESKPTENDFRNMLQAITSPLKREWSTIGSIISPPRDLDDKENLKKCKHCITMDIREQFNKEKLENMANSTRELQLKAHMLSRKSNSLYSILCTLVKQKISTVEGFQKLSTGAKDWEIMLSSDKNKAHSNF